MSINNACNICSMETINDKFILVQNKRICSKCVSTIVGGMTFANDFNDEISSVPSVQPGVSTIEEQSFSKDAIMHPTEIKARLDQYVVGQDQAKKVLSVGCYSHYKRCNMKDDEIKKSNILLLGPTGSGKTYLVETLAKIMGVPLAICTATTLTEAGYIGDDVESVVKRLLDVCDNDIEKAQRGIIFIDEVDKLVSSSTDTEKKVGGKGVQQALLRLLEGSVVSVPLIKEPMRAGCVVDVDTSGILFICGGAFPEIETIVKRRINQANSIGFNSTIKVTMEENILNQVTNEDLIKFGLIPEFIGRLPVKATLEALSVDTLKRILSEPKGSLLSQYKKLFNYDGIDLIFEDSALERIAEKAIKLGTGARSLRAIMEECLLDLMFEMPAKGKEKQVIITSDFVDSKGAA